MKKQTAVEWLVDELRNQIEQGTLDAIAISKLKLYAKDVEKEQIEQAFFEGAYGGDSIAPEHYYNQTYK